MLTEKPTARAVSSGRVSEGRVNSQKIRVGPQPSVRAITVIRGSRWRQAGRKINSIHGTTHSRWPHRTVHHSPSSQAYSASRYWPSASGRAGSTSGSQTQPSPRFGPQASHSRQTAAPRAQAISARPRLLPRASICGGAERASPASNSAL